MLLDVIKDAATEHEVYFLLQAYIEAIRHDDEGEVLPHPLRRVPLHRLCDLEERVAELTQKLAGAGPCDDPVNHALMQEAHGILTAALTRLKCLGWRASMARAPAMPKTVTSQHDAKR